MRLQGVMRDQYLKSEWQAYPAAPEGCQSLHQFLKAPKAKTWVGGRMLWQDPNKLEGGVFLLSSFAHFIECHWELPFVLLGQKDGGAKAMSNESLSQFFRYGDQVAVFVEQVENQKLKISEMMFLAPALKEPKLSTFKIHQEWQGFVQRTKDFFKKQNLEEITTTTLVGCPGLEPTLEPFQTKWKVGSVNTTMFLPTSPEIQLKKKICQGATDVFEIKTCFRNEEKSPHHLPEFHMLEWYRGYSTLDRIEQDVENLVNSQLVAVGKSPVKFQRKSIAQLMQQYLNFELTPQTSREQLKKLAKDKNIETSEQDSWNDVFHRIWIEHIETQLPTEGALIVHSYPPSQAALARTGKDGWIERFEFYWEGIELANAFHEVNDPHLQMQRWQQEIDERKHLKTTELKTDEELLALQHTGMPPTSGIALGMERLFMAIHKIEHINQIWN